MMKYKNTKKSGKKLPVALLVGVAGFGALSWAPADANAADSWEEVWEDAKEIKKYIDGVTGAYKTISSVVNFITDFVDDTPKLGFEDVLDRIDQAEATLLARMDEQEDTERRIRINDHRGRVEGALENFRSAASLLPATFDEGLLLGVQEDLKSQMDEIEATVEGGLDPVESYHLTTGYNLLAVTYLSVLRMWNEHEPGSRSLSFFSVAARDMLDLAYTMVGSQKEACSATHRGPDRSRTVLNVGLVAPVVDNNHRKSEIFRTFYNYGKGKMWEGSTCQVNVTGNPICTFPGSGAGDCDAYVGKYGFTLPSDYFDECIEDMYESADQEFNADPVVAGLQGMLNAITVEMGQVGSRGGPTTSLAQGAFLRPSVHDWRWSDDQPACDNGGEYYIAQ